MPVLDFPTVDLKTAMNQRASSLELKEVFVSKLERTLRENQDALPDICNLTQLSLSNVPSPKLSFEDGVIDSNRYTRGIALDNTAFIGELRSYLTNPLEQTHHNCYSRFEAVKLALNTLMTYRHRGITRNPRLVETIRAPVEVGSFIEGANIMRLTPEVLVYLYKAMNTKIKGTTGEDIEFYKIAAPALRIHLPFGANTFGSDASLSSHIDCLTSLFSNGFGQVEWSNIQEFLEPDLKESTHQRARRFVRTLNDLIALFSGVLYELYQFLPTREDSAGITSTLLMALRSLSLTSLEKDVRLNRFRDNCREFFSSREQLVTLLQRRVGGAAARTVTPDRYERFVTAISKIQDYVVDTPGCITMVILLSHWHSTLCASINVQRVESFRNHFQNNPILLNTFRSVYRSSNDEVSRRENFLLISKGDFQVSFSLSFQNTVQPWEFTREALLMRNSILPSEVFDKKKNQHKGLGYLDFISAILGEDISGLLDFTGTDPLINEFFHGEELNPAYFEQDRSKSKALSYMAETFENQFIDGAKFVRYVRPRGSNHATTGFTTNMVHSSHLRIAMSWIDPDVLVSLYDHITKVSATLTRKLRLFSETTKGEQVCLTPTCLNNYLQP